MVAAAPEEALSVPSRHRGERPAYSFHQRLAGPSPLGKENDAQQSSAHRADDGPCAITDSIDNDRQ